MSVNPSRRTRRKRSTTRWRNSLTDLPEDVLMEIFCRLPLKALLACKCVCKIFNDLASSSVTAAAAVVMIRFSTRNLLFFDPEVDPQRRQRSIEFSFTKFPFLVPKFEDPYDIDLLGSCKGLLYLESRFHSESESVVFNPVTNEYVKVPGVGDHLGIRVFGFSVRTNKYKVLNFYRMSGYEPYSVEILEVGSGLWRNVETGHHIINSVSYSITHLNGAAYMLESFSRIVYFDFDKEELGEVAVPSELKALGSSSHLPKMDLGVFGGCLCAYVNHCQFENNTLKWKRFFLWVMRKDFTWSEELVIDDFDLMTKDFPWSKELAIDDHPSVSYPKLELWFPFQVLSNGEILMLWEGRDWFCYHPKYKTMRFLGMEKPPKRIYKYVNEFVPSFLPLKDQLSIDSAMVQRGFSRIQDLDEDKTEDDYSKRAKESLTRFDLFLNEVRGAIAPVRKNLGDRFAGLSQAVSNWAKMLVD